MKVAKDHVVGIEYQLRLADGTAVDQSRPGQPLHYMHGRGQIVPGLERALEGVDSGESRQVVVPAAEGYGEHDPRGVQQVPRAMFPEGMTPQPGQQLQAQGPRGETVQFEVKKVEGDQVTVDLNHPLAGKELHFDIKVVDVRPATAEELSHGHVHGPGGHHHG